MKKSIKWKNKDNNNILSPKYLEINLEEIKLILLRLLFGGK